MGIRNIKLVLHVERVAQLHDLLILEVRGGITNSHTPHPQSLAHHCTEYLAVSSAVQASVGSNDTNFDKSSGIAKIQQNIRQTVSTVKLLLPTFENQIEQPHLAQYHERYREKRAMVKYQ